MKQDYFLDFLLLSSTCIIVNDSFSITKYSDFRVFIHNGPEAANWSTEREYSWDGAGYSSIYGPETWTQNEEKHGTVGWIDMNTP